MSGPGDHKDTPPDGTPGVFRPAGPAQAPDTIPQSQYERMAAPGGTSPEHNAPAETAPAGQEQPRRPDPLAAISPAEDRGLDAPDLSIPLHESDPEAPRAAAKPGGTTRDGPASPRIEPDEAGKGADTDRSRESGAAPQDHDNSSFLQRMAGVMARRKKSSGGGSNGSAPPAKWKKWLIALAILAAAPFAAFHGFLWWLRNAEPGEHLKRENIIASMSTETPIYYDTGGESPNRVLGVLFDNQHRIYTPIGQIPDACKNALIAAEDAGFREHDGFSPGGVARAMWQNIRAGAVIAGGSTLTQQTAKNIFNRKDRTLGSKFTELRNALQLEKLYSKDDILEFYFNQFYVNSNGRGIGVAARYFFNKEVRDLSLHECAFIAGSVKGPNLYNPLMHPPGDKRDAAQARATRRVNYVMDRMLALGMVDQPTHAAIWNKPPPFNEGKFQYERNVLVDAVAAELTRPVFQEILDAKGIDNPATAGLEIVTSIKHDWQLAATYGLRHHLTEVSVKLEKRGIGAFITPAEKATPLDPHEVEEKQFLHGKVIHAMGGTSPEDDAAMRQRLGLPPSLGLREIRRRQWGYYSAAADPAKEPAKFIKREERALLWKQDQRRHLKRQLTVSLGPKVAAIVDDAALARVAERLMEAQAGANWPKAEFFDRQELIDALGPGTGVYLSIRSCTPGPPEPPKGLTNKGGPLPKAPPKPAKKTVRGKAPQPEPEPPPRAPREADLDADWPNFETIEKTCQADLEARGDLEGAVIVLEKGLIRAMVGGEDNTNFNRATVALRQFGSTFKPLVYYAASLLKWSHLDTLFNEREVFVFRNKPYFPRPDHGGAPPFPSMVWAAAKSENLASVWLLYHLTDRLGDDEFWRAAEHVGLAQLPGESGEDWFKRLRDKHEISASGASFAEGLFAIARRRIADELPWETISIHEKEILPRIHYGENFDRIFAKAKPDRKEQAVRTQIAARSFLRLEKLEAALERKLQPLAGTPGEEIAPPALDGFYTRPGDDGIVFWFPSGREGFEALTPSSLAALAGASGKAPADLLRGALIDGLISGPTIRKLRMEMDRLRAEREKLPRHARERLIADQDFRVLVGLHYVTGLALRMGVSVPLSPVLSLTLGANEITLADAAAIYQTFLTGETWKFGLTNSGAGELSLIKEIRLNGEVLYQRNGTAERIAPPGPGQLLAESLQQTFLHGTAAGALFDVSASTHSEPGLRGVPERRFIVPMAGKTGTTNNYMNSAFVGFVPLARPGKKEVSFGEAVTIAAYVGYDDNRSMTLKGIRIAGASGALPVWIQTAAGVARDQNYFSAWKTEDFPATGTPVFIPIESAAGGSYTAVGLNDGVALGDRCLPRLAANDPFLAKSQGFSWIPVLPSGTAPPPAAPAGVTAAASPTALASPGDGQAASPSGGAAPLAGGPLCWVQDVSAKRWFELYPRTVGTAEAPSPAPAAAGPADQKVKPGEDPIKAE